MSVLDKFKESLTPEDFTTLEESIKSLIEEKAKIRAEVLVSEETQRIEALAEDFTEREIAAKVAEEITKLDEEYAVKTARFKESAVEKIQEYAEAYVAEQVEEIVGFKVEELTEAFEKKAQKLEESVLDNLDKFLDLEISTKISDSLLETIAINEAFKPIVNGIKDLFESHYVTLDTDGVAIVKAAEEKAETAKTKLNESYSDKIALQSKIDELQTALLISTKTEGLTSSQKTKVKTMFEGKDYSEVSKKIDTFIEVLEEKESLNEDDTEVKNDDIFLSEDDAASTSETETSVNESETHEPNDREIRLQKINQYLD